MQPAPPEVTAVLAAAVGEELKIKGRPARYASRAKADIVLPQLLASSAACSRSSGISRNAIGLRYARPFLLRLRGVVIGYNLLISY